MAAKALRAGDGAAAVALYQELIGSQPEVAGHWFNLALARRQVGEREAELQALDEALALEPRLLPALLLKGGNLEDRGDLIASGQTFKAALAVAPPPDRLPPELRPLIRRAQAGVARFQAAFEAVVRERMIEAFREVEGKSTNRFDQSVDVLLGKKAIYRQNPHNFYFPCLPETQFYERDQFPWLAEIERNTDAIRSEFEAVWRTDHGFTPYIEYPRGAPVDQWAELNHSPRWSVLHLIRNGAEVAENAVRCPNTMALLGAAPAPKLVNRCPNAMFSLLKPHTRIPPHTGETNVRLVVHIPLIIPDQTGFRVGNDVRSWRPGEALVFNDTIEHEAWNDSDQLRVVLIFDIWHPDLLPTEQVLADRLMAASDAFTQGSGMGL
jgi:aspartate beta-hydroxylase